MVSCIELYILISRYKSSAWSKNAMHNTLAFLFVSIDKISLISLQCMCLLKVRIYPSDVQGSGGGGGLRGVVAHS